MARFLPSATTKQISDTFVEFRFLINTEISNRIFVDRGPSFGERFVVFGRLCNVDVFHTAVESPNSVELGERYHQPLQSTIQKESTTNPHVLKELLLAMSDKTMSDTLGTEVPAPSAHMFEELSQIRAPGWGILPRSDLVDRAQAAEEARGNMASQMDNLCLYSALQNQITSSALTTYKLGDQVLI